MDKADSDAWLATAQAAEKQCHGTPSAGATQLPPPDERPVVHCHPRPLGEQPRVPRDDGRRIVSRIVSGEKTVSWAPNMLESMDKVRVRRGANTNQGLADG